MDQKLSLGHSEKFKACEGDQVTGSSCFSVLDCRRLSCWLPPVGEIWPPFEVLHINFLCMVAGLLMLTHAWQTHAALPQSCFTAASLLLTCTWSVIVVPDSSQFYNTALVPNYNRSTKIWIWILLNYPTPVPTLHVPMYSIPILYLSS